MGRFLSLVFINYWSILKSSSHSNTNLNNFFGTWYFCCEIWLSHNELKINLKKLARRESSLTRVRVIRQVSFRNDLRFFQYKL